MADDEDPIIQLDGIHVGDMVIRPVPSLGTDSHLDTPSSRERTRRTEEDEQAARLAGEVAPPHPLPDPTHPAPVPVLPLGEGGAVDTSIEEARARLQSQDPEEVAVPILLRDPLTGKVIGSA